MGKLAPVAASVLMRVLFAARSARIDVLRAVCNLARFITTWTSECDQRLHRPVRYTQSPRHTRMVGWVGDNIDMLQPHMYSDADFAGCGETHRAASGVDLELKGSDTHMLNIRVQQAALLRITLYARGRSLSRRLRNEATWTTSINIRHRLLPHRPALLAHAYHE